jgi:hypothetical protein
MKGRIKDHEYLNGSSYTHRNSGTLPQFQLRD